MKEEVRKICISNRELEVPKDKRGLALGSNILIENNKENMEYLHRQIECGRISKDAQDLEKALRSSASMINTDKRNYKIGRRNSQENNQGTMEDLLKFDIENKENYYQENKLNSKKHFILLGDFNANHSAWNCLITDGIGEKFLDKLNDYGIIIHNTDTLSHINTSNNSRNNLDLVLSSPQMADVICTSQIEDNHGSDH
ncbi:hypothetical protein KPH14_012757 [Odynerus spinipes]|uniref:Endonuclease/exonuclease/phosphatase domain-containing protein n=1 Tax=Odynerus spinipes TaxID=1348599 RepID=A0AAD9R8N9_9HYME|nr:hypothetical protein KPH14_012757 [Odynerus spinipes]